MLSSVVKAKPAIQRVVLTSSVAGMDLSVVDRDVLCCLGQIIDGLKSAIPVSA